MSRRKQQQQWNVEDMGHTLLPHAYSPTLECHPIQYHCCLFMINFVKRSRDYTNINHIGLMKIGFEGIKMSRSWQKLNHAVKDKHKII